MCMWNMGALRVVEYGVGVKNSAGKIPVNLGGNGVKEQKSRPHKDTQKNIKALCGGGVCEGLLATVPALAPALTIKLSTKWGESGTVALETNAGGSPGFACSIGKKNNVFLGVYSIKPGGTLEMCGFLGKVKRTFFLGGRLGTAQKGNMRGELGYQFPFAKGNKCQI